MDPYIGITDKWKSQRVYQLGDGERLPSVGNKPYGVIFVKLRALRKCAGLFFYWKLNVINRRAVHVRRREI